MKKTSIKILATWMITATIIGCGRGALAPEADQGGFDKYVKSFQAHAEAFGLDGLGSDTIPIEFDTPQDPKAVAECRSNFMTGKRIVVQESTWNTIGEESRESLLFHELGHCVLGRSHRMDLVAGGLSREAHAPPEYTPASLMNPEFVPGEIYKQYRDFYLRELFTGNE